MLRELDNYKAALALPTHSGSFGFSGQYYGSPAYHESKIGLAYAMELNTNIDVGIQFNYNSIGTIGYGHASAVTFEAAMIIHVTEKFHTGIQLNNPVAGKFGTNKNEKLPFIYTAGFGYDASEKFFVSAEIIKVEDQPSTLNVSLQYKVVPQLLIRSGLSTNTSVAWFGCGIQLNTVRLDVYASYQPQLGSTPGLMLLFDNKRKEE